MSNQSFERVDPVSDLAWIRPKDLTEGDTIEGVYVESIITQGTYGEQVSYKILTIDKELVAINGTGELKKRMNPIDPGSYILITYTGSEEKEITDKETGEVKVVDVFNFTVDKATAPFVQEVQDLMKEAETCKNKPKQQQGDTAAATGGRRF